FLSEDKGENERNKQPQGYRQRIRAMVCSDLKCKQWPNDDPRNQGHDKKELTTFVVYFTPNIVWSNIVGHIPPQPSTLGTAPNGASHMILQIVYCLRIEKKY